MQSIKILRKKGFSLVEVMVAAGIAAVVFLFIQNTINNLNRSQKILERRLNVLEVKQDIINLLEDKYNCKTTFFHISIPKPSAFDSEGTYIPLDKLKYLIQLAPQIPHMFSLMDFLINYYTWEDLNQDGEIRTPHDKYQYEHIVPPSGVKPDPPNQRVHLFRQYAINKRLPLKVKPLSYELNKSNVDYYDTDIQTSRLTLFIKFGLTASKTSQIKPARIPLYFQVDQTGRMLKCSTKLPL